VTVDVTGFAEDPVNPSRLARHRIRAVFRLIPRALANEPAGWNTLTGYTLYQSRPGEVSIDVPCRIEGPVRFQDRLGLAENLAWPSVARERYLADLNAMRFGGTPDYRPFTGPIELPFAAQPAGLVTLLGTSMGITATDVGAGTVTLSRNGFLGSYQLYPGGAVYSVQSTRGILTSEAVEPDPILNPLGIYVRYGSVDLYDNVSLRGTLVALGQTDGDVQIRGTGIHISSLDLPPLEGSNEPVRLPVLVLEDDFRIYADSQGTIEGLMLTGDEFEVQSDAQEDIDVPIAGHVIAGAILIRPRDGWPQSTDWWQLQYDGFLAQESTGIPYFPRWLTQTAGLNPAPQLRVSPDPTSVRYHWKSANIPIYMPHPDDEGLRWDLLEWSENP
jgi:hypothetical protein